MKIKSNNLKSKQDNFLKYDTFAAVNYCDWLITISTIFSILITALNASWYAKSAIYGIILGLLFWASFEKYLLKKPNYVLKINKDIFDKYIKRKFIFITIFSLAGGICLGFAINTSYLVEKTNKVLISIFLNNDQEVISTPKMLLFLNNFKNFLKQYYQIEMYKSKTNSELIIGAFLITVVMSWLIIETLLVCPTAKIQYVYIICIAIISILVIINIIALAFLMFFYFWFYIFYISYYVLKALLNKLTINLRSELRLDLYSHLYNIISSLT